MTSLGVEHGSGGSARRTASSDPRPARTRLGLLVLVVGALLSGPRADAGDTELAKFLLKGAREDLDRKQPEDAIKKLAKARIEDPGLLEAAHWQGVAHEVLKDPKRALVCYREFVTAYEAAKAAGGASRDQDELFPKAQARLAALDVAGVEFRKLQDAYVAQLLVFAEENFIRDPVVTTKALRMVLDVRPEVPRAMELLQKLGGAEAEALAAASDPLGVREWKDLLDARLWPKSTQLEFGESDLTFDAEVGKLLIRGQAEPTGATWAYDAEARFGGFKDDNATFGMAIGGQSETVTVAMFFIRKVELTHIRLTDLTSRTLGVVHLREQMRAGDWHRFSLSCDGTRVEVLMDGKEILEAALPEGRETEGPVGLYVQQARVEVRKLRVGKKG